MKNLRNAAYGGAEIRAAKQIGNLRRKENGRRKEKGISLKEETKKIMGYELHITRRENWFDENEELAIPLEEWEVYIRNDPEFSLDNYAEAVLHDGAVLRAEAPGIAVWEKYSANDIKGNYAWFYYSLGNIACKNPDKEIIEKMIGVAKAMNAKVQGDEGEVYRPIENGQPISDADNTSSGKKKKWWKFRSDS